MSANKKFLYLFLVAFATVTFKGTPVFAQAMSTGNPQSGVNQSLQPTGRGLQPSNQAGVLGSNTSGYTAGPTTLRQLKVAQASPAIQLTRSNEILHQETDLGASNLGGVFKWLIFGASVVLVLLMVYVVTKSLRNSR